MPVALTMLIGARLADSQTLTCDFCRALSQETLRSIGAHRRPSIGRYEAPGISSWHYILKRLDAGRVEQLLAEWS